MNFAQPGGFYIPTMPQPQRFFAQPQVGLHAAGQPRWQVRGNAMPNINLQNQFRGPRPGGPRMGQMMQRTMMAQRGPPANFKYVPNVHNTSQVMGVPQPIIQQVPQPQAAVLIQGQEPLTASMLAAAPPQKQKQMLGERLFPLIQAIHPDLAGKITGMLLEIDNSELVHMLEHQESLKSKVCVYPDSKFVGIVKIPQNRN